MTEYFAEITYDKPYYVAIVYRFREGSKRFLTLKSFWRQKSAERWAKSVIDDLYTADPPPKPVIKTIERD